MKDPTVYESGTQTFLLRSNDPVYGLKYTRVRTRKNVNIREGHQLYVAGYLSSTEFVNASNKRRLYASIDATETTFLGSCHQDINFVQLKAHVCSKIIDTTNFSMFQLVITYLPK